MKSKLTIFLLPLFFACSPNSERRSTVSDIPSNPQTAEEPINNPNSEPLDWSAYQDSLRIELLNSKPDNFLKGSLLEELYIRDVVIESNDSLHFKFSFDLHGFDCGAPDCYSTELRFGFPHNNKLEFPNNLDYLIYDTGCLVSELPPHGTMTLFDQNDNFVHYYSSFHETNLLIVGDDQRKEYVYYFWELQPDVIQPNLISELINKLPDTALAPYRSTQLLTQEYERFLNK